LLSSAQVVITAPCDVHAKVAEVAVVVVGGCEVSVTVGSVPEAEAAPTRTQAAATAHAEANRRRRSIGINSER
jgi:hypothetical protein